MPEPIESRAPAVFYVGVTLRLRIIVAPIFLLLPPVSLFLVQTLACDVAIAAAVDRRKRYTML